MRLALVAVAMMLAGCSRAPRGEKALRVGVTPVPAGELISHLAPSLRKQGVEIRVVSFSDYIQPNLALSAGELDANLYQNVPFMNQFNHDHGSRLVSVVRAYRGLLLLQAAGLIGMKPASGAILTVRDVASNPKHLQFRELEAAQLPRSLQDVDAAVINANFALDAGLSPARDTLFRENTDSAYANVLAVNSGSETDPRVVALARAITSEDSRQFLQERYKGAVSPSF